MSPANDPALVEAVQALAAANQQAAATQVRHADLYERQLKAETEWRAARDGWEEKAWAQREQEAQMLSTFSDATQQLVRRMEMIERLVVDLMKKVGE